MREETGLRDGDWSNLRWTCDAAYYDTSCCIVAVVGALCVRATRRVITVLLLRFNDMRQLFVDA